MGAKKKVKSMEDGTLKEEGEDISMGKVPVSKKEAREHKQQLERLKKTQPEFYKYLEEVDQELLNFDDDGIDDDADTDVDDKAIEDEDEDDVDDEDQDNVEDEDIDQTYDKEKEEERPTRGAITMAMVDSWCNAIHENGKIAPVRSLLRAFRTACHYGDDGDGDSTAKLTIMSSDVFNKVMIFTLSKMDGILRNLMKLPSYGGKKEKMMDVKNTKQWTKYNHLVKSYLGNSLHVMNQMTDVQMISFTLRRLKYSSLFLAAFPTLLRRYIKVALHFWGTGGGDLPVVAFMFLRDLCIRLGSNCLDECLKGLYKAYVMNCQFVNATKLQHIHFLRNCVVEFLRVDLPTAYQHGFVFIRQLAMLLREALDMKTKEAFRKVYEWKFINCLELWTGAICEYGTEPDFRPLAYPLTQIICGVARLVPTARYFPLRLRCARMLNRITAATNTFIPVSMLLLDTLEMKELHRPPTGGVGKAVDLHTILKVSKPALKTRSFQEACVFSMIEELTEHLAQWSYSVAFYELSFIPAVRLRAFCKSTKIERFHKEMKDLIRQIDSNSEFINGKRATVSFLPNDVVTSFLEDDKQLNSSPLSKYVATLRQRAQQRSDSLMESSVVVGAESSIFAKKLADSNEDHEDDDDGDDGATVFSSSWLPGKESREKLPKEEKKKKNKKKMKNQALEEDIVEDLVLSSDEEELVNGSTSPEEVKIEKRKTKRKNKHKHSKEDSSSKNARPSKKRKQGH